MLNLIDFMDEDGEIDLDIITRKGHYAQDKDIPIKQEKIILPEEDEVLK